jgi:uncharacterized membrane protein YdbT with pleckstrin-like domain
MAYPRKLLGQDEHVIMEMRPHWRSLIVPALVLLGTVIVASYLASVFDGSGLLVRVVRTTVIAGAILLVIGWSVRPFLQWLSTDYVFTDRRIIVRTGVLRRIGRDMPLSRVNNVTYDKTLVERILNCGTLSVQSAAEQGSLVIASVPDVETMQREVYRLFEEDDARRRGSGGPTPDSGA